MTLWYPVIALKRKCEWGKCPDEVTYPRVFCTKHEQQVRDNSLWYPTEKGDDKAFNNAR